MDLVFAALQSKTDRHLILYEILGKLSAFSITEKLTLSFEYNPVFLKLVFGESVTWEDSIYLDSSFFHSSKFLLENKIDVEDMLNFSIPIKTNSKVEIFDLIPNGREILVTDENKKDFIEKRFQ
jgi:E3 ubiquitin-protein ligase HUWE1